MFLQLWSLTRSLGSWRILVLAVPGIPYQPLDPVKMSKGWWLIWVLRRPWEPSLRGPWKCSQDILSCWQSGWPTFPFWSPFQVMAGLIMFHEKKSACCIHHLCNMVVALQEETAHTHMFLWCIVWTCVTISLAIVLHNSTTMSWYSSTVCATQYYILQVDSGNHTFEPTVISCNICCHLMLMMLVAFTPSDLWLMYLTFHKMMSISKTKKKSRAETVPGAILHQDKKEGYEGTEFWSPRKLQPRMFVLDDVRMVQTLRQAVELPTSEETTDIMGKNMLTYIIYRNNICIICIWKHSVYCISAVYWLIFGGNFGGELPFVSCQVRLGFKFIPASWLFSFGFAEHRCY